MSNIKLLIVILPIILTSCSHYKSSWDCKNTRGLGCTSISKADEIARKHIILNEDSLNEKSWHDKSLDQDIYQVEPEKTILLNEHYSDFTKYETTEMVIN